MRNKILPIVFMLVLFASFSLTTFAQGADANPSIPRPTTKSPTSSTTVSVPENIKPKKTYTICKDKKYTVPKAVNNSGDSFSSSNTGILTVEKDTGRFQGIENGTAYIVVTNGTDKSYIKITVGTGTTATDTTSKEKSAGAGVLSGYNVTVNDKTTPAVTSYGKMSNGKYIYYFASGNGTLLGSISGDDQRKIAQAGADSGTMPTETKDMVVWFANQFNLYRGISSVTIPEKTNAGLTKLTDTQLSEYANEVIRIINEKREASGLHALKVDSSLMSHSAIRAKELDVEFSHVRPNGVRETSECITSGGKSASEAVHAWMNSNPHRNAILNEDGRFPYNYIGVGCYQSDSGKYYWVVTFSI